MEARILKDIETSFGYLDALRDLNVLSEDKYQDAHKSLWNLRAIVNVALNEYEKKGK
jgi:hypothetical protein